MNDQAEDYYLGALTLSEDDLADATCLLQLLALHNSNCAILFSRTTDVADHPLHYTTCWRVNEDSLIYYDANGHLEGPSVVFPSVPNRVNFMHTKIGILLGKGIKDRYVVYFS